jgi:outer membrane lipoprotein-sorting protein
MKKRMSKRMTRRIALALAAFALSVCAYAQSAAPPSAPTVDRIVDRYIAAIGGRAAIQKQTSRVSLGTIDVPSMGLSGTVMVHEKAPDKLLQVVIINSNAFREGYDGNVAWTDDPADGTRVMAGAELAEMKRDADFFHELHLHEIYPNLSFKGIEKVGDRDAYLLEGTPADESVPDRMYFDIKTGLPMRFVSHHHSPEGESNLTEDFQDYRTVEGLQMPFIVAQTGGSSDFTIRMGEVHLNVALDDSEFAKPSPGPSP